MKKICLIITILCGMSFVLMAQESSKGLSFDPQKGKPIIQVFGNFHTGFGSENNDRGFELDRSYLGYQYSFSDELQVKAVMDIGQSDDVGDYQRIAYIKNAQITWTPGKWTLDGGLISTTQFKVQEKFWGYRYIMKSFQDEYKFGSSADLGISAAYQFNELISVDAIVVNGEGYKKIQQNDGLLYGIGATITPLKGLSMRLYGSVNEAADDMGDDAYNWAAFMGYQNKFFSLGVEYNILQNSGFLYKADQYGLSVYGSARLSDVVDLFARYDNLSSKDDWNIAKDEAKAMFGAQFKVCKYVKIAPNVRMIMPQIDGAKNKYSAYVSCYFGL